MQATQGKLEYGLQLIQAYCLKQATNPHCVCCGRSNLTLLTCPHCGELLCQDCLDTDAHVCEPN